MTEHSSIRPWGRTFSWPYVGSTAPFRSAAHAARPRLPVGMDSEKKVSVADSRETLTARISKRFLRILGNLLDVVSDSNLWIQDCDLLAKMTTDVVGRHHGVKSRRMV